MWQGYLGEVYAVKNSRKGGELPTALAVLETRWTGLWGQWPVRFKTRISCSLSTCSGLTLAGWQTPTQPLWPLLTEATAAANTWRWTPNTPHQGIMCAAGVPMPPRSPAAAHHTALWLETKTTRY